MSEEFSFDIDENSMNELKKTINYDEIEARHRRFVNGTETEDDLINGIYHYKIQNDKGLDLDVVEFKYYNKLIDLYQTEKIGNANLQILLDEEKEKNKEYFAENENLKCTMRNMLHKDIVRINYISKDKIRKLIKKKQERIDKLHPASDCVIIDDLENQIEAYKQLLEERN